MNEPAFPIKDINEHPGPMGLTLRDFFAASVATSDLAGIRVQADREMLAGFTQPEEYPLGIASIRFNLAVEAGLRYEYADAMLKASGR